MMIYVTDEQWTACAAVHPTPILLRQRLNSLIVLNTITTQNRVLPSKPNKWATHPTVAMWRPYSRSLNRLLRAFEAELLDRGVRIKRTTTYCWYDAPEIKPHWLTFPYLFYNHKALLVQRDPEHYGRKFGMGGSILFSREEVFWPPSAEEYASSQYEGLKKGLLMLP